MPLESTDDDGERGNGYDENNKESLEEENDEEGEEVETGDGGGRENTERDTAQEGDGSGAEGTGAGTGQEETDYLVKNENDENAGKETNKLKLTYRLSNKTFKPMKNIPATIKTNQTDYKDFVNGPRPYYPEDKQLCLLSMLSYEKNEKKIKKMMAEYWTKWKLDRNWKLIAIGKYKDGYFGAAFWHDENRHLVISHRGTNSCGACWADIRGVLKNRRTSQIHSACTFAFKVLQGICPTKCSISITGHSLGGWLAQVTTFALEFLTIIDGRFSRIEGKSRIYHPHTVTFDSPGCKEMLNKLSEYFPVKNHSIPIPPDEMISGLDIVTYCLRPNDINMFKKHVGTLITFEWVPDIECKLNCCYTVTYHKISNFITILHLMEKNTQNLAVATIWPCNKNRSILSNIIYKMTGGAKENKKWYRRAKRNNNYEVDRTTREELNSHYIQLPYERQKYAEASKFSRVFTENEWEFLQNLYLCKTQKLDLSEINNEIDKNVNFLYRQVPEFKIEEKEIICQKFEKFVSLIKWLLTFFPDITSEISKVLQSPKRYEAKYIEAKENYISNMTKYFVGGGTAKRMVIFRDQINLEKFLESAEGCGKKQISISKAKDRNDEIFRIYSILKSLKNIGNTFSFLKWSDIAQFKKDGIDPIAVFVYRTDKIDRILIIDLEEEKDASILEDFYNNMSRNFRKKIIFIASESFNLNSRTKETNVIKQKEKWTLEDLSFDTENHIRESKMISIKGECYSLNDFFSDDERDQEPFLKELSFDILKENFFGESSIEILHRNDHFNHAFSNLFCLNVKEMIQMKTLLEFLLKFKFDSQFRSDLKILITGMNEHEISKLRHFYDFDKFGASNQVILKSETESKKCLQIFHDLGWETEDKSIFWFHVINQTTTENPTTGNINPKESRMNSKTVKPKAEHSAKKNSEMNQTENRETADSKMEDSFLQCQIFDKSFYRPRKFYNRSRNGNLIEIGKEEELIKKIKEKSEKSKKSNQIILISGKPGTGKSASMLALARKIPKSWIIWVNIAAASPSIGTILEINLDTVTNFLLEFTSNNQNNQSELKFILLKFCLAEKKPIAVNLFFDGFDEIWTIENQDQKKIQDNILNIISFLKNKTSAKIWITTRERKVLMNKFNEEIFEVNIKESSPVEKRQFLEKFWLPRTKFYENHVPTGVLENYVAKFLKKLTNSQADKKTESFLGIPLQLRMIAELCQPNANDILTFSKNFELNICQLYEKYIDRKLAIYFNEIHFVSKLKAGSDSNIDIENFINGLKIDSIEQHGLWGVRHFFPSVDSITTLTDELIKTEKIPYVNRAGLIQIKDDGSLIFLHETFANYFSAVMFIRWMKSQFTNTDLQNFIYNNIFLKSDYKMIRYFINGILLGEKDRVNRFKKCPEHWDKNQKKDLFLHGWIQEGNKTMVETVLECFHKSEHLKDFIDAQNSYNKTALHVAVESENTDIAFVLLEYGANVDKLDKNDLSPWVIAFEQGNYDLFFKMKENDKEFFKGLKGSWVLRRAIQKEQMDIAVRIIQKGAIIQDEHDTSQLDRSVNYFDCWNLILTLMELQNIDNFSFNEKITLLRENDQHNYDIPDNNRHNSGLSLFNDIEFLLFSIKYNKWNLILTLIERSEDELVEQIVNVKNKRNQTLLHFAVADRRTDVVDKLIEKGAIVNASDKEGISPLDLAKKNHHQEMIDLLMKKGALLTVEKFKRKTI